ncbi:MAG TPA: ATP-binding protein [Tepidisphaeraceae bacterium]|jgi:anti-sigma regulatory factor (Ser/Thr protein kinase)|nr:ATP-binding protein [Tepidisphaeraceae bacterium]
MHRLRLEITSDPIHLAPVRRQVEAFATSAGFDETAVCDIGLCLNEAMANVTRHAYGGATDKPILIEAGFENKTLEIKMRDWGNGRDPSSVPPKKDPLTPGGLGMVCLRSLMDEMVFTKQPDGMLLTMRRRQ